MTIDQTVESSLAALKADPKYRGVWDEDRAWKHIRDVTGITDPKGDAYLQQIADRVELAIVRGIESPATSPASEEEEVSSPRP